MLRIPLAGLFFGSLPGITEPTYFIGLEMRQSLIFFLLLAMVILSGCDNAWNNPYLAEERGENILYSSFSERPKHLDPAISYSSDEITFTGQIYEPVLQYHYLKRPYQLVPLTSKQMPQVRYYDQADNEISAEGDIAYTVYEITIQPGILYQPHPAFAREGSQYQYYPLSDEQLRDVYTLYDFTETDSRELIAEDYIYQIKRLAHPGLNSPILGLMGNYIEGLTEYSETLKSAREADQWLDLRQYPLSGVESVDRYTYRIKIKGHYPQFIYWLAMPFFSPIPWEADRMYSQPELVERNITLDWYPVGTGPFMLSENNPNLRMVMSKNPNFHGELYPTEGEPGDAEAGLLKDAGKPLPFIDKIVFSLDKESIPLWNKFQQGYYDASGISSDAFDQAISFEGDGEMGLSDDMQQKGIQLRTSPASSIFYMGFNMLDPVVGGESEQARLLRQAISIAVDYEEFNTIFRNGRGLVAQGPLAPGIFGYREGKEGINPYVFDWVDGKAVRKSIDYAKGLLVEAGYPEGRDAKSGKPLIVHFDVSASGPDDKAWLNWYRKQFEKIDIQLVVRNTDYNRFREKMVKGNAQLFMWGWNADYPDPENFLFLLHGPEGKANNSGSNSANYANPEFDQLFEQMKNMPNSPERLAIIDQMVEIVRHDSPWLFGFYPVSYALYHQWYSNLKRNMMANNTLKYARIDGELRAQLRSEWNPPIIWPLVVLVIALIALIMPAFLAYRRRERSAA